MIAKMKELFNDELKYKKKLWKLAERVNEAESTFAAYSDHQLKACTEQFRQRLRSGAAFEEIQTEAFAAVREAAKRTLGQRHFDVQLIGGFVMKDGGIAQMNTGEGKTLAAALPGYLWALSGEGVHIITANEYLARRDREQMGQIYEFLGLSVGLNISGMEADAKKAAYQADLTYGTGTEFGFDYLRDQLVLDIGDAVQRGRRFAIIDEADSILIDEAKTPMIIASQSDEGAALYRIMASIVRNFKKGYDYEVFEETRQTFLTDEGAKKIEQAFGIGSLFDAGHQELLHYALQSLRAAAVMRRDTDYIVKDGKISLIDPFTGRILEGRSYSEGLHQAIEAKENLDITAENETHATMTVQNYFRQYKHLAGMTGSAEPAREEFWHTYQLRITAVPPNRPLKRIDHPDLLFRTREAKVRRVIEETKREHDRGRPVLIGTASIEQSEYLSAALDKAGISHELLNAKTEADEAGIVAKAGQRGSVMLATNMAGRGTDIRLGGGVAGLGGLHIIGTERNESLRIDMQLIGRAGRQGDAGSSRFILSLEDEFFQTYDQEELAKYTQKVRTDENGLVVFPDSDKFIRRVQETMEGIMESGRLHILKLENVLDSQSRIVYRLRRELLELPPEMAIPKWIGAQGKVSNQTAEEVAALTATLKQQLKLEEHMIQRVRRMALTELDDCWSGHLARMAGIKDEIMLRGYAQEDPYAYYEKLAAEAFDSLLEEVRMRIFAGTAECIQIGEEE